MKLKTALMCLDCEELFDQPTKFGSGRRGCPVCGSEQYRRINDWFLPPEVKRNYFKGFLGVEVDMR